MTRNPNKSKRALVSNLCPELSLDSSQVETLIETLDRSPTFDAPPGELSIAFVSREEIARLHADFMGDPSPTDVITFPGDPDIEQAGEICVCPEVAHQYAQKEGLDFSRELSLYLIHGYLHLCGFDDRSDADRQQMREAERAAMKATEASAALPQFSFQKR